MTIDGVLSVIGIKFVDLLFEQLLELSCQYYLANELDV